MAVIAKLLKNTELESVLKIKSQGGGSVTVSLEQLCYKPDSNYNLYTGTKSDSQQYKFQDCVPGKSSVSIVSLQWAGKTQSGNGVLYRGGKDLEHLILSLCVGDTCQLDMEGQDLPPDAEYATEDFDFEMTEDIVLWIKLRKHNFKHYTGEYASWGQYEDETRVGPKKEYEDQLRQNFPGVYDDEFESSSTAENP